jgi:hypothetical protein
MVVRVAVGTPIANNTEVSGEHFAEELGVAVDLEDAAGVATDYEFTRDGEQIQLYLIANKR